MINGLVGFFWRLDAPNEIPKSSSSCVYDLFTLLRSPTPSWDWLPFTLWARITLQKNENTTQLQNAINESTNKERLTSQSAEIFNSLIYVVKTIQYSEILQLLADSDIDDEDISGWESFLCTEFPLQKKRTVDMRSFNTFFHTTKYCFYSHNVKLWGSVIIQDE